MAFVLESSKTNSFFLVEKYEAHKSKPVKLNILIHHEIFYMKHTENMIDIQRQRQTYIQGQQIITTQNKSTV